MCDGSHTRWPADGFSAGLMPAVHGVSIRKCAVATVVDDTSLRHLTPLLHSASSLRGPHTRRQIHLAAGREAEAAKACTRARTRARQLAPQLVAELRAVAVSTA